MSLTHATIFDALQKEFCPPLDSSLVAALLVDVDFDAPSAENDVEALRQTLKELAVQAEVDAVQASFSDEVLDKSDDRETITTTSFFTSETGNNHQSSNTTPSSNGVSTSSDSDVSEEFATPLGFLQAALPHVPTKRLRQALREAEEERARRSPSDSDDDLDMWDVIASVLTTESIREMEERGFEGLLEDEELARLLSEQGELPETRLERTGEEWVQVTSKKGPAKKKAASKPATVKITLNDVRQKGASKKVNGDAPTSPTSSKPPSPDRWTQVVSLSSLLSTLFPDYPATFFQSHFHSPNYPDSYEALCAILQKICASPKNSFIDQPDKRAPERPEPPPGKPKSRVRTATDGHHHPPLKPPAIEEGADEAEGGSGDDDDDESSSRETALLFNLLDVLLPQYGLDVGSDLAQTPSQDQPRSQLISEIQLAVQATKGREDDALDLVKLLRELDEERKERFPELMEEFYRNGVTGVAIGERVGARKDGVSYAELAGANRKRASSSPVVASGPSMSNGTTSVVASPVTTPKPVAASVSKGKNKPSPYQWQAVPVKKAPEKQPYQILPHLPTYTRDVNGIKRRGKGVNGDYLWRNGLAIIPDNPVPGSASAQSRYLSEAEAAEREYRRKIGENMRKRDELLREAARMWTRGVGGHGAKLAGGDKTKGGRGRGTNIGGEVAWYFAERAREFQEMAKKESLNAARAMVHRKRMASNEKNTIDLHGTTVVEALAIVREVLAEQPTSQARPLKIITGRGSHSVNQTSVLKPALKKRLTEEGWVVGTWDAGLFVRGRR
ncbi:hypothetical protein CC2G_011482 [Coprinopsis cinerea AmutBmut pab1-1]|nr:hypothetical protein CC2G_011482 [Coprinopsis cinerea AmutBmut pab1-1]